MPYSRGSVPKATYRGALILSTPSDWGPLAGAWRATLLQSYRSGGETVYNPDAIEERNLPEENFIPVVDYYNTDVKVSKGFVLPGGRSVSAYATISNLWNTKRLNGAGLGGVASLDYRKFLVGRRQIGEDVEYGDPDTFDMFTKPWKNTDGDWVAPLAPRTEWLHHVYPRAITFGLRFNL